MAKCKFDGFINEYDKVTKGQYSYYYRNLWDAYAYAEDAYSNKYDGSIWEKKKNAEDWVHYFGRYIEEKQLGTNLQVSVKSQLKLWFSENNSK